MKIEADEDLEPGIKAAGMDVPVRRSFESTFPWTIQDQKLSAINTATNAPGSNSISQRDPIAPLLK